MGPRDFARVAKKLANGDIAAKRTAVSRLYYAMHHIAWDVIREEPPPRGSRHGVAIDKLDKLTPKAAALLRDMLARRREADYELDEEKDKDFNDLSADFERYKRFLLNIGYQ